MRHKIYKHLVETDVFGIATKIKEFRKPNKKNNGKLARRNS